MVEILFDKGTYKKCKSCGRNTWIGKTSDYCFDCQVASNPIFNNTKEQIEKSKKQEKLFRKLHGFDARY